MVMQCRKERERRDEPKRNEKEKLNIRQRKVESILGKKERQLKTRMMERNNEGGNGEKL